METLRVEKAEDCPVDVEGLLDVSSVATSEEGVVPPVDLAARMGRLVGTREDRPGCLLRYVVYVTAFIYFCAECE